jgi:hypothetical protein
MPGILDQRIDPSVRHVFAGSGYVIGEFNCPLSAAGRWRVENWIGAQTHVVVPATSVGIAAHGAEAALSTPNDVLIYDPEVWYQRTPATGQGDRCLFFMVSDSLAAELELRRPAASTGSGPRLRRRSQSVRSRRTGSVVTGRDRHAGTRWPGALVVTGRPRVAGCRGGGEAVARHDPAGVGGTGAAA